MREIKFRAYYEKEEISFYVMVFDFSSTTDPCWTLTDYDWRTYPILYCHVMQFTWVKDKNWVDIYESDIVYFAEYNSNAIVEYQECKRVFRWLWEKPRCVPDTTDMYCRNMECEVVGNIYENKELLDDNTKYNV